VVSLDPFWPISHTPSRSLAHLELHKEEDLFRLSGHPHRMVDISEVRVNAGVGQGHSGGRVS